MRLRARWLESREQSCARRVALLPLAAAAVPYAAGAWLDRALHRSGLLPSERLPGRVVSVGSLSVGGTGKTPLAAWIAARLHQRGRKVVLASRGYGGRRTEDVLVVSDGRSVRSRAERAGDEPLLLAAHAPAVPVLVARDRVRAGRFALAAFGAEVLVLDDGFQHHRLQRDVDLVTIDAAAGFGNGWVLPRGPLREPLGALRYAHAVLFLDGEPGPRERALLERWAPGAQRFRARRRPRSLSPLAGGSGVAPQALAGAEVGMLAGIARPASLRRTLERLGARVVAERSFPDHHRYRAGDLRALSREAPLWVTTEKDALKIPRSWVGDADLRVLAVELEVDEPAGLLDWLESRLC